MTLNCRVEMVVQRIVCFVCTCWLANQGLSLKLRRQVNAPPTSGRSDQRVAAPTCFEDFPEHLSSSLIYDQSGPVVHRKEMTMNCRIKLAFERVACLVCACWLANRRTSLNSRQHVHSTATQYPIPLHDFAFCRWIVLSVPLFHT